MIYLSLQNGLPGLRANEYKALSIVYGISEKEAKALVHSFATNKTLTQLDVDNNEIGEEGAKVLAHSFFF